MNFNWGNTTTNNNNQQNNSNLFGLNFNNNNNNNRDNRINQFNLLLQETLDLATRCQNAENELTKKNIRVLNELEMVRKEFNFHKSNFINKIETGYTSETEGGGWLEEVKVKRKILFSRILKIMAYTSFLRKLNNEKDTEDELFLQSIQNIKSQLEQPNNNSSSRCSEIYHKFKMNEKNLKGLKESTKLDNEYLQQIIDVFDEQRKEITRMKESLNEKLEDFNKIDNEIITSRNQGFY